MKFPINPIIIIFLCGVIPNTHAIEQSSRTTKPTTAEPPLIKKRVDDKNIKQARSFYQTEGDWKTDEDKTVKLKDFAGEHALVTLIFTKCQGTCPMIMQSLKKVDKLIKEKSKMKFNVLAISLDPGTDTPQTLNEYRKKNNFSQPDWHFIVSSKENTRKAAGAVRMGYGERSAATEQIMHTNKIVLIDPKGTPVVAMDGLNVNTAELEQYIKGK
jgi:protein SCO1/2